MYGLQFFDETSDDDDSLPKSSLAYQATAALSSITAGSMDSAVLMVGNKHKNLTDEVLDEFYDNLLALAELMAPPSDPFAIHTYKESIIYSGNRFSKYPSPKPHLRSPDAKRALVIVSVLGWDSTIYTVKQMRDGAKSLLHLLPDVCVCVCVCVCVVRVCVRERENEREGDRGVVCMHPRL